MAADVLSEIVASTRAAVAERMGRVPQTALPQRTVPLRRFRDALAAPGLSMIAEHKRASPSAGVIRADLELADVVSAYERGGARALSVLTEETRFGGSLDDIVAARAAAQLPILRKDFTVDEYQIHEAHSAGADAVLLIVAALPQAELQHFHAVASGLGLGVLVEVHNRAELERALAFAPPIIGINNRNLATLQVDLATTFELRAEIPDGTVTVAESGFRTRSEFEQLAAAGVDAVLIGEALMRAPDIEAAVTELLGSDA
jgi:indole-3-glycerol phosphate synthase